jgi:hypothetical protein
MRIPVLIIDVPCERRCSSASMREGLVSAVPAASSPEIGAARRVSSGWAWISAAFAAVLDGAAAPASSCAIASPAQRVSAAWPRPRRVGVGWTGRD